MAAARLRRMDGAGDGEHFAPLLRRQPRRDERAGSQRGLHHQRALRKPGDDAVAPGEVGGQGRRAERIFADHHALAGDAVRQVAVAGRIDTVQPRADHGDGAGAGSATVRQDRAGLQGPFVRSGIDAERQPRDDAQARAAQRPPELPGVLRALRGRVAAADDGQAALQRPARWARPVQPARGAEQVQQQRGIFGGEQGRGIGRVAQRHDAPRGRIAIACGLRRVEPLPGGVLQRGEARRDGAQRFRLRRSGERRQVALRLLEDLLRQAEGSQQPPRRARAHAGSEHEAQPCGEFVALHAGEHSGATPLPRYCVVRPGATDAGSVVRAAPTADSRDGRPRARPGASAAGAHRRRGRRCGRPWPCHWPRWAA